MTQRIPLRVQQRQKAASQAPAYGPAPDARFACGNCAHGDQATNTCRKYAFRYDPQYTCADYLSQDAELSNLKHAQLKQNAPNNIAAPSKLPQIPAKTNKTQNTTVNNKPVNNTQTQPQNTQGQTWRPSVSAQLAQERGGTDAIVANVRNILNPAQKFATDVAAQAARKGRKAWDNKHPKYQKHSTRKFLPPKLKQEKNHE